LFTPVSDESDPSYDEVQINRSALGKISGFTNEIFPATSVTIINVCSNFGLVVFMFLVGLEVNIFA
jgi:predicted transglutaminase-like protease